MPKLIDDQKVLDNPWVIVDKESSLEEALAQGEALLIPLRLWHAESKALQGSGKALGVWLDSDESVYDLENDLDGVTLIALNFPAFKDGRAYSSAAILRQQLNFKGDLRAIGDVLRDQLCHMRNCGFSSFLLQDSVKVEEALKAFDDFKYQYQSTVRQPTPLFRRRGT